MARNRKFVGGIFVPLLVVIGTTLLALFVLFMQMVSHQNELSRQREEARLAVAIEQKVDFLANNLRDYSRWSDAFRHLVIHPDDGWANDNIGPYLFNNKGYTHTFVIDPAGRTHYASNRSSQSREQASAILDSAFVPMLSRLNAASDGAEDRFARLAEVDGRPAIVAASAILPNIGEALPHAFARRYLIIVQPIDVAMIRDIAGSFGIADLRMERGPGLKGESMVPLRTFGDRIIAHLNWTSARPGDAVVARYLPWLLAIAFQAIALCLFIVRRAHRLTQDLEISEATAWHFANHDTLTGLPNRRALRKRGIRQRHGEPMAMLYLDLDGFKEVNDLFGHQAGDVLLVEATERLRKIVGEQDMLARVGGDEFAILVTSRDAHETARALASTIVETMARPFASNGIRLVVSASVGVALGSGSHGIDDLLRFADVAMYCAKGDGKNRWRIYGEEMDEGRAVRMVLESELRDAVESGEIDVLFQPIVEAQEGRVTSIEALARWVSPTQGPVGPAIFIPIAEESGLIVKLGELVLRKACMAARDWNISLSVNISPAQFWHRSLVNDILAILDECGFPPERLELEITEGYLLSRPDIAAQVIRQIRSHGIRVALDDFGTGFASIGYLRKFELDRLKLDRSFVEFVDTNRDSAKVTKAVIGLSHALNLPITAEGVETDPQAMFLALAGCERLQGWHYGRAVDSHGISAMLERGERQAALANG